MADTPKKSNINNQYNVATTGLNMDSSQNQIKKGALSYALNAALENYDANSVQYQNEPGNEACFDFPAGYKLMGRHFIPEQNKIIFFLANPESSGSEIGYMVNNDCVYHTLINDSCLNFDVNHPVLRLVHKVTNFGTEIYWADNNGRRYLDLDNIPYIPLETSEVCDPEDSSRLDCNKILLQPDINIPLVDAEDVISGGEITSGTYQFTVQYADATGNPYTSYFGVTNPTPIADVNLATPNFNYRVGKSIIVNVDNLNPLGQYQYFNLAVIKTINGISTPELVGTYFIEDSHKKITYTGQIQTNIQLSMNDIFEKFTFYDNADYVTAVQDVLVWKGMTAVERLNYQKIANEIKLQWQSYRLPASNTYEKEINASKYRGYLRDEVYAFEIVFLLKSGKQTDGFHIPGRVKGQFEITAAPIDETHPDFIGNPDEGETTSPYWKIYNTANVEATSQKYDPLDDNYEGPYQYGDFAYWESTEEYPCDEEVWGGLAGQKIRHHKFPDVLVSPIIESPLYGGGNTFTREGVAVFPLGVKIDSTQIQSLIALSNLTQEQKDDIVGYKIVRADRGVNKSIIAKGMLRNVGKYEKDDKTFLYPNYPYNDVSEDPFLNSINNAWSEQCEEWTIEVYRLPSQEDVAGEVDGTQCSTKLSDATHYVAVEYQSCENNKITTRVFTEIGTHTVCSLTRPRFISAGEYNEATSPTTFTHSFADNAIANWQSFVSQPKTDIDANCYPSSYDVYYIQWDNFDFGSAGMRPGWNDFIMGERDMWLTYRNEIIVRVPIGTIPYCTDGACFRDGSGNQKMRDPRLIQEVRPETDCKNNTPLSVDGNEEFANRQIFNSPETSFGQPFLGNILKLESVMYGGGKAHFVEVRDNAKYKLLTKEAQEDALLAAEKVADLTSTFSVEAMFSVYNSYIATYINGITRKNYAYSFNSIASYNYMEEIPNAGDKQRTLDIKRYISPDVLSVGEEDDIILNNYNRETSVYLRSTETIPYPHTTLTNNVEDKSRFTICEKGNCASPEREEDISVVSYYGSLKNEFVNQYGQIYSYESIDTGFVKMFDNLDVNKDVIFGGDTFIGKFAYKTKVPFFFDNRVNAPNDSDIFYDEIGNIAFPKYWHSSRSILETFKGQIGEFTLPNFISYKAHSFDCPNDQGPDPMPDDDDPENYPDRTFYDGYYYLFAYGVPSFYCESSYNLDLRTAFNNKEGDFWPHVSTGIPDEWVQEKNVSILNDNTYNYNVTFSKQNKESVITHLPADWGTGEDRIKYPFRAVYSDKQITDADNRINNWLTYRPSSYFDFPQNYGGLTALDGLKNSAILARFENKSLLYNNLLTIDTSNPQAAYVGNPNMFSAPPIDFAETDQGYVGCQNKMLLKTPYGALSIDAKRGQIFLINGTNLQDLSQFGTGMHRWFTAHLPFEILKYFPDVNSDNNFNGVGLHGVFDSNYERAILTKIDYIPAVEGITHEDGKYFIEEKGLKREIFLFDSDYFCNVSWTISFNFNTNSWISFHSYIPSWYVGENNFYYSGLNYCPNDFDALVGVLDTVVPTTTSTTTIPLTTTTSTTIPEPVYDCGFDADAQVPDCTLEGFGFFLDEGPIVPCERPDTLLTDKFYSGYTLVTPVADVDSTVDSDTACSHLGYYNIYGEDDLNYTPEWIDVDFQGVAISSKVYDTVTAPDCTTIPDGWYFTSQTAAISQVFKVVAGEITEIVTCGVTTTTTTTTVTYPYDVICWTGVYEEGDPIHPLGGVITYHDTYGNIQTVQEIWNGDYVVLEITQLISAYGAVAIPCTTTTTTTTV